MSNLRFVCNSRIIDIRRLGQEKDWVEMEAMSLSNQVRWGGLQDEALSVAKHCVLVSQLVETLTRDLKLAYLALHHEIEEAFGVGDIIHEVKHFLFSKDKTQYNEFKNILIEQLGLEGIDHPRIKEADLVIGFLEAEQLYPGEVTEEFYSFSDCKGIMELVDKYRYDLRLTPQNRKKDRKEFLDRHYDLKARMDYAKYRLI